MRNKVISCLVGLILFSICHTIKATEPSLVLQIESGEQISLDDYVGKKPTYLKFWATWCAPCMEQMPHFERAFEVYGDKIQFIAINIDLNETQKAIQSVKKKFGLSMPMMTDNTGRVAQYYQFLGTPYHVLLDRTGKVIYQGHDADSALNKTLKLLSHDGLSKQTQLLAAQGRHQPALLRIPEKGIKGVYFTAAWCDWYLADSRPSMSKNCINGQSQVNRLFKQGFTIESRISQLWTDAHAATEYITKFNVRHPISIDFGNELFIENSISIVPTLIIYKDGKIIERITDFSTHISLENIQ